LTQVWILIAGLLIALILGIIVKMFRVTADACQLSKQPKSLEHDDKLKNDVHYRKAWKSLNRDFPGVEEE